MKRMMAVMINLVLLLTTAFGSSGPVQSAASPGGPMISIYLPVVLNRILLTATAVSTGADYTCAVTSTGGVMCWGLNDSGQVGDGTNATRFTPVTVSGISTASAISAGFAQTCAILAGGSVKCWGANDTGQLGNGTTTGRTTPVNVTNLPNGAKVSTGRSHTCALTTSNEVKCWGSNLNSQLGIGISVNRYTPVEVIRK